MSKRQPRKIVCAFCAIELVTVQSHQRFCSSNCRQNDYNRHHPGSKKEYNRKWRLANRERLKAYDEANRERINTQKRESRKRLKARKALATLIKSYEVNGYRPLHK